MRKDTTGVLFVCLGNICRSPLAEGIFRSLVREAGLEDRFDIDSAGTSGYHDGEGADPRTIETAGRRGVRVDSISRRIVNEDFARFDWVLAMDDDNRAKLERLSRQGGHMREIGLLRAFDPEAKGDFTVPDPYYGGARGFENVHDIVERSCRALLEEIRTRNGW